MTLATTLIAAALSLSLQQAPPPETSTPEKYEKVKVSDPDVQAAVKVALADQQRIDKTIRLLSVVSAERPAVSGNNLRLCILLDRSGNTEFTRVTLSRNPKKQWSVTTLSWGSCGR